MHFIKNQLLDDEFKKTHFIDAIQTIRFDWKQAKSKYFLIGKFEFDWHSKMEQWPQHKMQKFNQLAFFSNVFFWYCKLCIWFNNCQCDQTHNVIDWLECDGLNHV